MCFAICVISACDVVVVVALKAKHAFGTDSTLTRIDADCWPGFYPSVRGLFVPGLFSITHTRRCVGFRLVRVSTFKKNN